MNIKKQYKGLTPKERKEEIRLLKKEIKPLLRHTKLLKECLDYLI